MDSQDSQPWDPAWLTDRTTAPMWLPVLLELRASYPEAHVSTLANLLYAGGHCTSINGITVLLTLRNHDRQQATQTAEC